MSRVYEAAAGSGNEVSREKIIIRTSLIGIVANVFLAAFKAVVGLMTNSIAIVLDAVNNSMRENIRRLCETKYNWDVSAKTLAGVYETAEKGKKKR